MKVRFPDASCFPGKFLFNDIADEQDLAAAQQIGNNEGGQEGTNTMVMPLMMPGMLKGTISW